MAPVRAQAAAEHYVSEKAFQTSLPEFRRMISGKNKASLRHAVEQLKGHLATGAVPPFAQMRSAYCYGDPNFNGLETDDDATHDYSLETKPCGIFATGREGRSDECASRTARRPATLRRSSFEVEKKGHNERQAG
jgi:hypothetical protein